MKIHNALLFFQFVAIAVLPGANPIRLPTVAFETNCQLVVRGLRCRHSVCLPPSM